jgi:hypothetical protein
MSNETIRKSIEGFLKKHLIKERVSEGNKKLDNLIGFLFIFGIVLLTWEVFIYRRTIIELKIPLLIWLTPGLFLTPLFFNKMNNIDGMKAHWILHYVLHTIMTGGFILFCFMASNFYLAGNTIVDEKFEVIKRGSLSGSKGHRDERKPYVVINYKGIEKQLIFSNPQMEKVMSAKSAKLSVRKGLFGFDIIEKYEIE